MKKSVFLLICISCIFALSQCNKGEFSCDDGCFVDAIVPNVPFDYSSVAFIARITDNSADWSFCVMDKSGNNMRKIVDMTVACSKPIRSRSGQRLLFSAVPSDSQYVESHPSFGEPFISKLYLVTADGTGLSLIDQSFTLFGCADWSPDDTQIVYLKYLELNSSGGELVIYNIADKVHTILQADGEYKSCPQFSPDGKQIVYNASTKTGCHIFKIDVDGENNHLFISNASSPKWSPLGDKIAYLSSGKDGSSQIFVTDVCGRNQKQLTTTTSPRLWPGWAPDGNGDPQWTPDGKKIVYVSSENEKAEIFIMNADGSKQTRLTKAEYWDGSPEVTPDGKYILFHSRRSDMMESGICMMKLDGSNQVVLSKVGSNPVVCR